MSVHKPVLLKESIDLLQLKSGMTVVDATLGGGGHSLEILKKILPDGKLIAIDQDNQAIKRFEDNLRDLKLSPKKENVILADDNFARLKNILEHLKIKKVGAAIADLGISSDQLENAGRGFSFMKNGPLDMRMDLRNKLTAFEIVNSYAEKDLARIIRDYGEEKYAGKIARAIREEREKKGKRGGKGEEKRRGKEEGRGVRGIETVKELVEIISQAVPEKYKHRKINFATRTFQALRIEVNSELENLKKFLSEAVEVLENGGRLAVISFHSGEDRIVKNFFRENARGCVCPSNFPVCVCRNVRNLKIITKKPIVPSEEEIKDNPRARSAKLRIAEKL